MAEFMFPNVAYRATVYRTGVICRSMSKLYSHLKIIIPRSYNIKEGGFIKWIKLMTSFMNSPREGKGKRMNR